MLSLHILNVKERGVLYKICENFQIEEYLFWNFEWGNKFSFNNRYLFFKSEFEDIVNPHDTYMESISDFDDMVSDMDYYSTRLDEETKKTYMLRNMGYLI
mgnify:CR=1 FL=1